MTQQDRQLFDSLLKRVTKLEDDSRDSRRVLMQDISPKAVQQTHINGIILFEGLAADRPTDGSTEVQAYFATDTGELSIWDGENWLTTTLT